MSGVQHLFENETSVGNPASTDETDLHTYTIAANQLATNGDALCIRAWILHAGTANNKRTRLYFGATLIGDSTVLATQSNWYYVEATVFRTGAATQKAVCLSLNVADAAAWTSAAGGNMTQSAPEETLSGTVAVRITGTSPTTGAANDVTVVASSVEYIPAA